MVDSWIKLRCATALVMAGWFVLVNTHLVEMAAMKEITSRRVSLHVRNTAKEEVAGTPPLTNFSGILARPFESWAQDSLPCFEREDRENWMKPVVQDSPTEKGFLFLVSSKSVV